MSALDLGNQADILQLLMSSGRKTAPQSSEAPAGPSSPSLPTKADTAPHRRKQRGKTG